MAVAPVASTPSYRVVDRRGQASRGSWQVGQPNRMIQGAQQTTQRAQIPLLDKDTHRNVSNLGRKTLMSLGRWLFWNFPAVQGAILEQATFASENFQPQYYGKDKDWGNQAEEWLLEWENFCCIEGRPYNMGHVRNQLVMSEVREGDMGVLLATEDGEPRIQMWPAHRIGSGTGDPTIRGGPFDGSRICDGVILDDFRRPLGYRLLDENGETIADVSANDFELAFIPKMPDQVRGFSGLASAVFDWQDVKESRLYELIAQKAASAVALIENNEAGEPEDPVINTTEVRDSEGNKTALATQQLDGGMYRYFKAGSESSLTAFSHDRPGANSQRFQDSIIRDAFQGIEWNVLFSNTPEKVGGASMRVVVEKINRTIRKRQCMLAQVMKRIHGWALAHAIKRGRLPMNDEWWKWEYQVPAELTADKKYDSAVDIEEHKQGFRTLKDIAGRRGAYWEDIQDQWLAEKLRLQERAKELGVILTNNQGTPKPEGAPVESEEEPENDDSQA